MSEIVQVRCVRADGQEFLLGTNSAWRILSNGLKGIDYPAISNFSSKNAVKDGAIITGSRVDCRDIQVKAKTTLTKLNAVLRQQAISFFRPKTLYKLYITYQGVTRWSEGLIEGMSCPSENIHLPMYLTVKFFCPDGYLKSVDDYGKNIASITPRFAFPYIQTPRIPIVADTFNYEKNVVITNDGDDVANPVIQISFKDECTNPKIMRGDYYVRMLGEFSKGDILVIDCDHNRITKNGTNWIQHIDRTSSLTDMVLTIGDNVISFGADAGDNNLDVFIYFYKRYLGI